jgi:hypothetical protein
MNNLVQVLPINNSSKSYTDYWQRITANMRLFVAELQLSDVQKRSDYTTVIRVLTQAVGMLSGITVACEVLDKAVLSQHMHNFINNVHTFSMVEATAVGITSVAAYLLTRKKADDSFRTEKRIDLALHFQDKNYKPFQRLKSSEYTNPDSELLDKLNTSINNINRISGMIISVITPHKFEWFNPLRKLFKNIKNNSFRGRTNANIFQEISNNKPAAYTNFAEVLDSMHVDVDRHLTYLKHKCDTNPVIPDDIAAKVIELRNAAQNNYFIFNNFIDKNGMGYEAILKDVLKDTDSIIKKYNAQLANSTDVDHNPMRLSSLNSANSPQKQPNEVSKLKA